MTYKNVANKNAIIAALTALLAGGCASGIDSKVGGIPKGVHAGTYVTNTGVKLDVYLGGHTPGVTVVTTPPTEQKYPTQQKYKR